MLQLRQIAVFSGLLAFGPQTSAAMEPDQIVQRATEALKSDWAADLSYAFTERDQTQKGARTKSRTFLVLMIDGSDYHFPLAFDDQPVSPAQHRAELQKLKNEIQRRKNEQPSARQARIAAWQKERNENGELLLDFPAALTFQFVGEEIKDGHDTYVFWGKPKPGLEPVTRAAKVLTGIEGKAWVDKETLHPIRVECTVIRPVPVYGPLASVLPGTDIGIRMTKVADSTWLIDQVSMELNVSKLHLFRSTSVTNSTYTHYRSNAIALRELLSEASVE